MTDKELRDILDRKLDPLYDRLGRVEKLAGEIHVEAKAARALKEAEHLRLDERIAAAEKSHESLAAKLWGVAVTAVGALVAALWNRS